MALDNKWTNPLRRAYQDIKNDLIEALKSIKDPRDPSKSLVTDVSEGNILIMIISLFAAIAEVLHYYIDNMARESFLDSARRYSSVAKIGQLIDYSPRLANAATVDVILTREPSQEYSGNTFTIPKDTQFSDLSGNIWLVSKDTVWGVAELSCKVPLIQHELYNLDPLNGAEVSALMVNAPWAIGRALKDTMVENYSLDLTIGGSSWTQVDTFAYSKPDSKHFRLELDDSNNPQIVFGDGKFGSKPTQGDIISLIYYVTKGASGNIESNSLTQVPTSISSIDSSIKSNNPYGSGDGFDYEDLELLRRHISLQAMTMSVAISRQDYINCALLISGVKEAALEYIQGRKLDVYISTNDGSIASSTLIDEVKDYLLQKAPLCTWLEVYPAGISEIKLSIEATGKKHYTSQQIQTSILNTLLDAYSPSKATIGGRVRISDIYALIDNLPEVDYLYITKFFINPWPKLIYGDTQLNFELSSIDKASGNITYLLIFHTSNSNTTFDIYSKNGLFRKTNLPINIGITLEDEPNGFTFSFSILDPNSNLKEGYMYEITISEPNLNYEDPGYNQVQISNVSDINLIIHETL